MVGRHLLPHSKELVWVLFMSECTMEREMARGVWTFEVALGVEPLLQPIERGQLGCAGHLAGMTPGRFPSELVQAHKTRKRPDGRPNTRWKGYIAHLS